MNTPSYPGVGIDVAKDKLDMAFFPQERHRVFPNTPQGHAQIIALLKDRKPGCIVLESSGPYHKAAADALASAGLRVHIAQAATVRYFARSLKLQAKTDRLDAAVLARYAHDRGRDLRPHAVDAAQDALKALVARRDDLVAQCAAEQNRLQQAAHPAVLRSIRTAITGLEKAVRKMEKEIDALIAADPDKAARSKALQAIPGVGPQTARAVIALLPELGQERDKRLNALVGVAPFADASGRREGRRRITGGRRLLRCALYMACMSAARHHPVIGPFYRQMRARGLPHNSAMTACMRRMLSIMHGVVRRLPQTQAITAHQGTAA